MKIAVFLVGLILSLSPLGGFSQNWTQIKKDIETSKNSPLYVKDILKKSFSIDTITIKRYGHFETILDSIATMGELGKVYGPYGSENRLYQVLATNPNEFNHVGQIFIDTSYFYYKTADSIANFIIRQVEIGNRSFEDMASTYSMGGEGSLKGDLGWIAMGSLVPQIERALMKMKAGDMVKLWSTRGVHIIRKNAESESKRGFALLLNIQWLKP